jgi:putative glutamine amidotransferase
LRRIAVSQRVEIVQTYAERRDALDQRWSIFLAACDLLCVPVPNQPAGVDAFLSAFAVDGILLTGGNDLVRYGGDAPERDGTDRRLIELGLESGLPILGVCRGMQSIQDYFNVPLERVEGHVTAQQEVSMRGRLESVNSYHCFGARRSVPELEVCAVSADGVVKAIRHRDLAVQGVMWHPERFAAPAVRDVALFRELFGAPR